MTSTTARTANKQKDKPCENIDIDIDECDSTGQHHHHLSPYTTATKAETTTTAMAEGLQDPLGVGGGEGPATKGDDEEQKTTFIVIRELSREEVQEIQLQKLLRELREAGAPDLDLIRSRDEEREQPKKPYFSSNEELLRCLMGSDDEEELEKSFDGIPTNEAESPEIDDLDGIPISNLVGCNKKTGLGGMPISTPPVSKDKGNKEAGGETEEALCKKYKIKNCVVAVERPTDLLKKRERERKSNKAGKTDAAEIKSDKKKSHKTETINGQGSKTAQCVLPKHPLKGHAVGAHSLGVSSEGKVKTETNMSQFSSQNRPNRPKWSVATAIAQKAPFHVSKFKNLSQEENLKMTQELSLIKIDSSPSPESETSSSSGTSLDNAGCIDDDLPKPKTEIIPIDGKGKVDSNQAKTPLKTEQQPVPMRRRPGPKSKTRPRESTPPPPPKENDQNNEESSSESVSPLLQRKRKRAQPIPSLSGSSSVSASLSRGPANYVTLPQSDDDSSSDEDRNSQPGAREVMEARETFMTETQAKSVELMRKEMDSEKPNLAWLTELLRKTKEFRLKYLKNCNYDFKMGMKMFPALKHYALVKREFDFLHPKIKGGRMELLEKSLAKILERSCLLPNKIPPGWQGRHGTWERAHMAAKVHGISEKKRKILGMICYVFCHAKNQGKVQSSLLFVKNRDEQFDPVVIVNPAVVVYDDELEAEKAKSMWIYAEGVRYVKVPNFYEGILTIYALHYVFNVVYPINERPIFEHMDKLAGIPV